MAEDNDAWEQDWQSWENEWDALMDGPMEKRRARDRERKFRKRLRDRFARGEELKRSDFRIRLPKWL